MMVLLLSFVSALSLFFSYPTSKSERIYLVIADGSDELQFLIFYVVHLGIEPLQLLQCTTTVRVNLEEMLLQIVLPSSRMLAQGTPVRLALRMSPKMSNKLVPLVASEGAL